MEPIKKDIVPSDEWTLSLNATCNRLSTQYLNLLKSASSVSALSNYNHTDLDDNNNNNGTVIGATAIASNGTTAASVGSIGPNLSSSASSIAPIGNASVTGAGIGNTTTSSAGVSTTNNNVTTTNMHQQQHDPRGTCTSNSSTC
jgi:hypothetical protein